MTNTQASLCINLAALSKYAGLDTMAKERRKIKAQSKPGASISSKPSQSTQATAQTQQKPVFTHPRDKYYDDDWANAMQYKPKELLAKIKSDFPTLDDDQASEFALDVIRRGQIKSTPGGEWGLKALNFIPVALAKMKWLNMPSDVITPVNINQSYTNPTDMSWVRSLSNPFESDLTYINNKF